LRKRFTLWGVIYRFQTFEVDDATFELRKGGSPIPLQRKDFDVLCYLIENRSRVVRKEELIEAVWSKESVVDTAVHRVVSRLRHALGQAGRDMPIETIHGRGYRFRAEVDVHEAPQPPVESVRAVSVRVRAAVDRDADPFVGRSEIVGTILQAYHEAPLRGGQVFLLTGEPGSGKSRAADFATRQMHREGATILRARGLEFDGAPAFWPWVQVLREVTARRSPDEALARRGKVLLEQMNPSGDSVGGMQAIATHESAVLKFRLQDQLSEFMQSLCAESGARYVLWMDDLSLRDQDSIRVLDLISCGLRETALIVLVTVRSDPALSMGKLIELMPDDTQVITLESLRVDEVERYVSLVTGASDSKLLADRIHRKTGGNPQFMREMIRFLVTTHGAENLSGDQVDTAHFPAALREVVDWRLRGFDEQSRKILEVASVLGESFELPLLERVTSADPALLFRVLDSAMRYAVLQRTSESIRFRFSHGLIQEVLYKSLPSSDRARLHAKVADALELHAGDSASLAELAFHAYRGLPFSDAAKVVAHAGRAARMLASSGAYTDAFQLLGWALAAQKLEPEPKPRRRCKLLANAALAAIGAGDARACRRHVEELVEVATRNRYPDILALAGLILRPMSVMALSEPDPLARQALEAAAAGLPRVANSLKARVLSALSTIPPYSYDRDKRLELTAQARELATPLDRRSEFDSAAARLLALSAPEDRESARELISRFEDFCYQEPSTILGLQSHFYRLQIHQRAFEPDAAARELRSLGQLATDWSLPETAWLHDRLALQESYYEGDLATLCEGVVELTQRALRRSLRFGDRYAHAILAHLRRELPPEALPALPLSDTHAELERSIPLWEARTIRAAIDSGRMGHANSELGRMARARFRDIPRDAMLLPTLAELSLSVVTLGERRLAEDLIALMRPFTDHNVMDEFFFSWGALGTFVGELFRLLGERQSAKECFTEALELNLRLRHRPQELRTRLAMARLDASDPKSLRRRPVLEQLQLVFQEARRLGLVRIEQEAEQELRKVGASA